MNIVRCAIARNLIGHLFHSDASSRPLLGTIELRDHQVAGVTRLVHALDKYRGALLCDEVGLGKTFTAAAVMRRIGPSVVVAPAVLLPMWRSALNRADITARLISLERFSRSEFEAGEVRLIVIDEAHHLRNRRTRRFRNVAAFIGRTRVLLMSATPLHNRRTDITSLLSLFLGSRAATLGPADMSQCVIRRRTATLGFTDVPRRAYREAVTPPASNEVRRKLIGLPPPVPPRDGAECSLLVQFTLLRQWASSDAALQAGLKTRIARARVLISALEAGTLPTRREMTGWITPDLGVQLGFAVLLAAPGGDADLLDTVREHERATCELLRLVSGEPSGDEWRAEYLRGLRSQYHGQRIVAFTQFAATARALFRLLKKDGKVGLVTADRCEIASGRVSRHDVISRFAPAGTRCIRPPKREEITLLIATDLCSEGLNLQDASVAVHLDMPWTPARVEQRIGRIARAGSEHTDVFIHALKVPAIAEELLRIEERLRIKSLLGAQLVGANDEVSANVSTSVADANEQLQCLIREWKTELPSSAVAWPFISVVESEQTCFVAVVSDRVNNELICDCGDTISDDPREIFLRIRTLGQKDVTVDPTYLNAIVLRVTEWIEQKQLEQSLDVVGPGSHLRKRLTRQIDRAARRAPVSGRATVGPLADAARSTLFCVTGAGLESRITDISARTDDGSQWLRAIAATQPDSQMSKAEPDDRSGFRLIALLVGREPYTPMGCQVVLNSQKSRMS